ncbi:hypothetical protein [Lentzea terrae]|uniref:hypothetical protein n=1 Tax=Lentzea terrae TaxID=2200761 RepID=UPI000DD3A678|nr:hypothetical protein [Lentzea terrae]
MAAVNAKNRDAALELISSSAFARFDELRKHALTSTEDQLAAALPTGPRATVYVLRAKADPAQLRSGTGRSIMSFMVEQGLVTVNTSSKYVRADGTTTVTQTRPQLTKLILNDDRATAELSSDDPGGPQSAVPLKFAFQTARFGAARAAELRTPIN